MILTMVLHRMLQMGEIEHHKLGQQESLPEYRVGDELVSALSGAGESFDALYPS